MSGLGPEEGRPDFRRDKPNGDKELYHKMFGVFANKVDLLIDSAFKRALVLVSGGAAVLLLLLGAWYLVSNSGANLLGGAKFSGRALIGGAFTLTDHEGNTVTNVDFSGQHMLVYFGYTFCPDVCPLELQSVTEALEKMGSKANGIVPIFITIDPERDTVPEMANYVENFHPRMRALTGTLEEVKVATRAYRVYFKKGDDSNGDEDYLMDHTSLVYFMGPEGDYLTHFTFGTPPDEIANRILEHLN